LKFLNEVMNSNLFI